MRCMAALPVEFRHHIQHIRAGSRHDQHLQPIIQLYSDHRADLADESNRAGVTVDAALSEFCAADIISQDDNSIRGLRRCDVQSMQSITEVRRTFPSQSRFNSHWPIAITECLAVHARAFCSPVKRPCARATNDSTINSDGNSGPHPI